MAFSFKEAPWYMHAVVFVLLAVVLLVAGEYVPGLPVASARADLQALHTQDNQLNQEVSALQVYERRYSEFTQEMSALNNQLDTLKAIVPEEKATDEFIRLLQGSAAASGVQIRRLTAQAVVSRQYHFEMPFEIQVDGPYFEIVDFFSRLSRLSRIINVGNLKFGGLGDNKAQYPVRSNTTVSGTCIVTTFFTMPAPGGTTTPTPTPAAAQTPGGAVGSR
jgi:type IV pilus assembly protein PilO